MFKKILIANRGEIAVRIIRTCRELGIATVALYQAPDRGSLHTRLADECVQIDSPVGFLDQDLIISTALEKGANAIHPGYGFLAERDDFIDRCSQAGVAFIGPPAEVVGRVRNKIEAIEKVRQAGFPTVAHSECIDDSTGMHLIRKEASRLGYPLIVKSCRGGRGRGARLVVTPERLDASVHRSQAESRTIYADPRLYLEKAIQPAHQISVQVVFDEWGQAMHLGEREGSLLYGNQKILEEAPAPSLSGELRAEIWQAALEIARLFDYRNIGTVEFLLDESGRFYFTEIKPRIQNDHTLTEMVTRIDLVGEQIRLAGGERLGRTPIEARPNGWAMQCRVSAEDPWNRYMPSPGRLRSLRAPGGTDVRLDTYLFNGCVIPNEYDPLIAKLITWGKDREACRARLERALDEVQFSGISTNLSLIRRIVAQPEFVQGRYSAEFSLNAPGKDTADDELLCDLAVVAAIAYLRQRQNFRPELPDRLLSGWHRDSRRLPS